MKICEPQLGSTAERNKKVSKKTATKNLSFIALGVAITTACAYVSVPIGTIPVTLQTFAVAAIGGILGSGLGCATIAIYVLMGLLGLPVFSGFNGGVAALMGATGGYIFGFLPAVFISGIPEFFKIKNRKLNFFAYFGFMALGLLVCYAFGTVWFVLVYSAKTGAPTSVASALALCVVPYVVPDLVKLALAALLTVRFPRISAHSSSS